MFTQFLANNNNRLVLRIFEIPPVPFAFDFESKWPNGNSATKQLPNYHLSDLEKSVEW